VAKVPSDRVFLPARHRVESGGRVGDQTRTKLTSAVQIPSDFVINEVPFQPSVAPPAPADIAPALGPLKAFTGRGFNTIFRSQSSATPTELPTPQPDSDNILELNLTIESLSFQDPLGAVPNRGEVEGDIFLNRRPVPADDQ
jgi:hypothetical protein